MVEPDFVKCPELQDLERPHKHVRKGVRVYFFRVWADLASRMCARCCFHKHKDMAFRSWHDTKTGEKQ